MNVKQILCHSFLGIEGMTKYLIFFPAARMQVQIHVMILCFDVNLPVSISESPESRVISRFVLVSPPSSWQFGQHCELRPLILCN